MSNADTTKNPGVNTRQDTSHVTHIVKTCWIPLYMQTNTNNINKTSAFLLTTGSKVRTEQHFYAEIVGIIVSHNLK